MPKIRYKIASKFDPISSRGRTIPQRKKVPKSTPESLVKYSGESFERDFAFFFLGEAPHSVARLRMIKLTFRQRLRSANPADCIRAAAAASPPAVKRRRRDKVKFDMEVFLQCEHNDYGLINASGTSGLQSINSSFFTISSVPVLYFLKCGV